METRVGQFSVAIIYPTDLDAPRGFNAAVLFDPCFSRIRGRVNSPVFQLTPVEHDVRRAFRIKGENPSLSRECTLCIVLTGPNISSIVSLQKLFEM